MSIAFKLVADLEDLSKAFAVRCIVFCGEQAVPYTVERDEHDMQALHIIGEAEGEPVAAARIRFDVDCARLEPGLYPHLTPYVLKGHWEVASSCLGTIASSQALAIG